MLRTLCTADELAQILGIARSQVYRLSRRGDIPVVVAGHHYRYDPEEVIATLKRPVSEEQDPDGDHR